MKLKTNQKVLLCGFSLGTSTCSYRLNSDYKLDVGVNVSE